MCTIAVTVSLAHHKRHSVCKVSHWPKVLTWQCCPVKQKLAALYVEFVDTCLLYCAGFSRFCTVLRMRLAKNVGSSFMDNFLFRCVKD